MSTTYFNNSNIKRLKNKKVSKKKDVADINADDEHVVENFTPSESGIGSSKEENPMSNVFTSSDSDKTTNTKNKSDEDSNTKTKSDKDSNTKKSKTKQLGLNSILVFCFRVLLSVLFVFIWGALATNAIYLISESDDALDFILPNNEYEPPYTKTAKKCWYSYGFPYNLIEERIIGTENPKEDQKGIENKQKDITYYPFLRGKPDDKSQQGVMKGFKQYLFEAVYGGLGKGGRTFIRNLLGILKVNNNEENNEENSTSKSTWTGKMENSTAKKVAAFIVWPYILTQWLYLFISIVSMFTTGATYIFGIFQIHMVWGIFFGMTIGILIAMANGFYMALQTLYIFFIYPWTKDDRPGEWKSIFMNIKSYMLLMFYFIIAFYGFKDLGQDAGGGIMIVVIGFIVMHFRQIQSSK
jgi:hypothetical protein